MHLFKDDQILSVSVHCTFPNEKDFHFLNNNTNNNGNDNYDNDNNNNAICHRQPFFCAAHITIQQNYV